MNFFNQSLAFTKLRSKFLNFYLEPKKLRGRGRGYKQIYKDYLVLVNDYNELMQTNAKFCELLSSICLYLANFESDPYVEM